MGAMNIMKVQSGPPTSRVGEYYTATAGVGAN